MLTARHAPIQICYKKKLVKTTAQALVFADAFMKGSLQFEGPNTAGSEGYSAGFGLIALPSVAEVDLKG